jgi:hypothetical protein
MTIPKKALPMSSILERQKKGSGTRFGRSELTSANGLLLNNGFLDPQTTC